MLACAQAIAKRLMSVKVSSGLSRAALDKHAKQHKQRSMNMRAIPVAAAGRSGSFQRPGDYDAEDVDARHVGTAPHRGGGSSGAPRGSVPKLPALGR